MKLTKKYKLVVDTDAYVGNFNRYMAAFVFGWLHECCYDEFRDISNDALKEYAKVLGIKCKDEDELIDEAGDQVTEFLDVRYDEYGLTVFEMTGLRSESITFFFEKNPKKILPIIVDRIQRFPAAYVDHKSKSWRITEPMMEIKGIHLFEEVTTSTEIHIKNILPQT